MDNEEVHWEGDIVLVLIPSADFVVMLLVEFYRANSCFEAAAVRLAVDA
jgi:hypothetical protein